MKKAFLALAAVATLFATSCKKENVNAPEEPLNVADNQFACVIDPTANPQNAPRVDGDMSQKACIDESNNVWWQLNDKIAYCGQQVAGGQPIGGAKDWYILNCSYAPEKSAAYFTAEGELHFNQGEHEAYYPASLHTEDGQLVLPQIQVIDPDRNASHLPMYAHSDGPHYLEFHNICAVLKIAVPTGLPSNCFKIVVTNNDNPFCGQFYVEDNKAKISNGVIGENEKHVDVVKTNNSAFTANEVVYVALPEGAYHNVSIQFYGKDTYGNDDLIFGSIIPDMTVRTNCIYPVTVQYRPEFCITSLENNNEIIFQQNDANANTPIVTLEYCTSSTYGSWQPYFTTTSNLNKLKPAKTTLNKGEKLYVRATTKNGNNTFATSSSRHVFSASGKYAVSGKISYLLDKDGNEPTSLADWTFYYMFANWTPAVNNGKNVIDACNLILLNKTSRNCYNKMFNNCNKLCAAPILPARNVYAGSYNNMFAGTNVTSIVLRATSIGDKALTSWINGSKSGTIHTTTEAKDYLETNNFTQGWNVAVDQQ